MLITLCPKTLYPLCIVVLYKKSTYVSWILCHPRWHKVPWQWIPPCLVYLRATKISSPAEMPLSKASWPSHLFLSSSFHLQSKHRIKISSKVKPLYLIEKKKYSEAWLNHCSKIPCLIWNCVTFALRHCQHWQFIPGNRDFRINCQLNV